MEIISLKGVAKCGKTYTLNIVYQLLLQGGGTQVQGHFEDHGNGDFLDVLKFRGKLIGIATQGDYVYKLKGYLEILFKSGCYKTICACTIKDGTQRVIALYPHLFIDKQIESDISLQRINDGVCANRIYSMI